MGNDWTNEIKSAKFIRTIPLDNWVMVYAYSEEGAANTFERELIQVARDMSFPIARCERFHFVVVVVVV